MIPQRLRDDAQAQALPIILGDGQRWRVPTPMVHVDPWKPSRTTLGPDYDRLVDAFEAAPNPSLDKVAALLNIGAFLIRRNFDVSDDELGVLLSYDPEAPARIDAENAGLIVICQFYETEALLAELMRVAFGHDEPQTFRRWQYLSLLSNSAIPEALPIADHGALVEFIEAGKRTMPRTWAYEVQAAVAEARNERMLDSLFA